MVYLIAGSYHPEFMQADGGKLYQEYRASLAEALEDTRLEWCEVKDLGSTDFGRYDVVFLNAFLDEKTLVDLYAATNIMLLPYRNRQQISSGVLADTVGSGRVAIATKFRYAIELLNPEGVAKQGLVIGSHARGILVDPEEASVEQIAQALDYLVFNTDRRFAMEKRAYRKGYEMRWENTAWAMLQYALFLEQEKQTSTGRDIIFKRCKESPFERINSLLFV
jgi:glycosyltransferase involved in cell wall biosynthesis